MPPRSIGTSGNKDELTEQLVDLVYGEIEVPDVVGDDWRIAAEKTAHKDHDPSELRDGNFDYGLQRVLDGVAARALTVRFGQ